MNYRSRVWRVISAYSACAYVDRPSQEVKMFANRRSETNYFSSTCNTRRYKKCAWILISLNLKLKSNFTPLSFDVCKKCSGNLAKMTVFVRDTFHLNLWQFFLIQVQKEIQRYSTELWPHDVLISEDAISFWRLYEITLQSMSSILAPSVKKLHV